MLPPRLATIAGYLAVVIAGAGCGRARTDDTLSAQVDAAVRAQMQEQAIPGMSLAVVRDGRVIKATGYGVANVELNVPVTPETVFEIGSITKQFTAAAVMLLVQDGKVRLDDSLRTYLPEAPPAWQAVTIRHLLTHTSGIPDLYGDTDQNLYGKGIVDFRRDYAEDELLQAYLALPLESIPGEQWKYCNTGYQLLGFLIHRITGKSYGDFLQERILGPLGMNATRVFAWGDIIPGRASGYDVVDGKWKNTPWLSGSILATADGGLLSTVPDLAKWDAALYSDAVLSHSSLDAMWTAVRLNSGKTFPYGLGWNLSDAHGHRVVWHTGGGFGFFANIARYTDDRLTIIVLTNADEAHTDVLKVTASVAGIYLPDTQGRNPVKDW